VLINAQAGSDYTQEKFPDGKPKPESYVVMPGNCFAGTTVDRTLERMPFRRIATFLAQELARREYWPATSPNDADLLLVVHWGVTAPRATMHELMGRTNPLPDVRGTLETAGSQGDAGAGSVLWDLGARGSVNDVYADEVLRQQADQNDAEASQTDTARLLGYVSTLRKYNQSMLPSVGEIVVHHSLKEERYFVIVMAYDLRKWKKGEVNKAVWTIRLNIAAPGNNFEMAVARMSKAAVDWFGRTSPEVEVVRAKEHKGTVELAPLVILGEQK
jgi:hypothetical protein